LKIKILAGKYAGEWQALFRADGWSLGYTAAMLIRRQPPPGYRLTAVSLQKPKSGRRVEVKLVIRHIDTREPALSAAEALSAMLPAYERGQDGRPSPL
jgi:hypothetical protein